VSTLGLVSVLSLEALTLYRLRQSSSATDARRWIDLAPGLPAMAFGSLVLLLLSGGYMTTQMAGWNLAWTRVTMGTLVLIAPLAAATGRRMHAIRRACAAGNLAESALIARLQDPLLKFSLNIRIALVLGIVLLMTAKPVLTECLGIVGGFAILGFASTLLFWRRDAVAPIVHADSRE